MKIFGTRARITFGLVCIVVSVLLLAMLLNILPDHHNDVVKGRAALCESVAVNASMLVSRQDVKHLEIVLKTLVKRNNTVLSAAVRRTDGEVLVEVAEHQAHWETLSEKRSTETQVQVPILAGKEKWGTVEIRFTPVDSGGMFGIVGDPHVRLILFVSVVCYVVIYFYLVRMLRHLNPSKAVPGHVRSAFDTLAEGLLILDKQGRIVLANHAFASTLDRTSDQILGLDASELPWSVDEDRPAASYPWEQVFRGVASEPRAMLRLTVGKTDTRTFMATCSGIRGHDGKVRGALVSLDDITQLKQQEVDLRKSKAAADAANHAKSAFLANMSHEIRTPMNAILGFADALRRGLDDNEQQRQEYLDTIHTSGKFLLALINDTLDLSKIEAGRLNVEKISCSPHQMISEVVEVLGVRARECHLSLDFGAAGRIPESIHSDPTRIRQIVTNLVGNAIKFTKHGGVKVVARMVPDCEPPKLAIDVTDTGIGIAAEKQESVFDPFVQADAATTRNFGGTGLGLAISQRLAGALGGDLTVHSEPGKGSTFTLTIDTGPLDGVELLDSQQIQHRSKEASQPVEQGVQALPSARVLVVDDGEPNRRLITLVLGRAGVHVETATNGQEAVDLVSSRDYDIVLMDMQMPVMDGYTATSRLREQGVTLPIIALTANTMHGDEEKCRAAGCTGFLGKPVDLDELTETVAAALGAGPSDESNDQNFGGADTAATCEDGRPSHNEQVGRIANPSRIPSESTSDREQCEIESQVANRAQFEAPLPLRGEVGREVKTLAKDPLPSPLPEGGSAGRSQEKAETRGAIKPRTSSAPADESETRGPIDQAAESSATRMLARAREKLGMVADDEGFREILERFVAFLGQHLTDMCDAWCEKDYAKLAKLAHNIKGTGGTAGFSEFTAPAVAIEESAKQQRPDGIRVAIAEIAKLGEPLASALVEELGQTGPDTCDRCESPTPAATFDRQVECEISKPTPTGEGNVGRIPNPSRGTGTKRPPVTSCLPLNDPEFREIVLGFLPRLQKKLTEMDVACKQGDLDALAKLAHWLKGAAGTVGFNAFTEPALLLEQQAKGDETDEIERILKELRELADAIEIPDLEECVS